MKTTTANIIKKIRDKFGVVDNTNDPRYVPQIAELAESGCHVYHVIDGDYVLGGTDEVHMTSYLYIHDEDTLDAIIDFGDGYAMAYVVNPTWDIAEHGSVAFKFISGTGMLKRVG